MTSERVIQANRRNAQASTGPRTTEGKSRSGRNAQTHGLTSKNSALYDTAEIKILADLIAGELGADPLILEAAGALAEAEFHLRRVQAFKSAVIQDSAPAAEPLTIASGFPDNDVWADLLKRLERLERYEQRAFSRRRTAIRRLDGLASRTRQRSLKVPKE